MVDNSTLEIVIDSSKAEEGANRVEKALSKMSKNASTDLEKLSKSVESINKFIDKTWSTSSLNNFNKSINQGIDLLNKLKTTVFSLQSTPIIKSEALTAMSRYYSAIEEADKNAAAALRAKGIYKYFDDLSNKSAATTSKVKSFIEVLNTPPSKKGGSWSTSDMRDYYSAPQASIQDTLRAPSLFKYFDELSNKATATTTRVKSQMDLLTSLPSQKGKGWDTSDMRNYYSQLESGSGIINKLTGMLPKLTKFGSDASDSFSRISKAILPVNNGLSLFFGILGGGYILKQFLDRLIDVNTKFTAFISTMNVITGSTTKSREEFEYISGFADAMGVSIESVTTEYGKLRASLKSVDESGELTRHIFEALSEASTVLHLRGYETNLMFLALQQSASKGKVSLEEFQRQLAEKLPGAMDIAARAMNMSQGDFRDAITKGSLNVYDVLIKLSNQIKKEFGDSAKTAAELFTGQMNRMKNAVFRLYVSIGESGAMDGLTKIIKAITGDLSDSSVGVALGKSLGKLFSDIADWISKITASDIQDFFLNLSGIVESFTTILSELVKAFSDTADGQTDFLGFGEVVAKGMVLMTDATVTFIAILMQIPLSLNVIYQDIMVVFAGLKGLKDWTSEGLDVAVANINAAKEERNKALALADKNLSIVLGSDDSPMAKAWKKTDDIFIQLRKRRAELEADNKSLQAKKEYDIRPKTDAEMQEMLSRLPKTRDKAKPGVENAFEQERLRLFKSALMAELEYANAIDNRVKSENKSKIELQAKLKLDKDYIALSREQKAILLDMADTADKAIAKKIGAEQFQSDMLAMNKEIYSSEMALLDISMNKNSIEEKNLRQFEEKLKFDSRYISLSDNMITMERQKAIIADKLAVSVESARKSQEYHNSTLEQSIEIQRQINQLNTSGYLSKYNNESALIDSFSSSSKNNVVLEADRVKMLSDARQRDMDLRLRDREQLKVDTLNSIDQMKFENSMYGETSEQIRRATELRKIEIEIKKLSAGATGDELKKYQELEEFLKGQMSNTLDEFYAQQNSLIAGLNDGISKYLDDISNVSAKVSDAVQRSFRSMEDMLVDFVMTGKLNFKDFINVVLKELVRLMIQLMIIKPLMAMFGGGFARGGSFDNSGSINGVDSVPSTFAANGKSFSNGGLQMFASGGMFTNNIVNTPTKFPIGLMGEAGPEAIMPLSRDSQGRLGIKASGESGTSVENNVTIAVSIQDGSVKDSGPSGNQIAERLKAVVLGVLNEELRPGGILTRS